ncbi:MAG TPA: protein-L-isoaspartate(D-aspartate) O-methyltransferase, partial [Gammaproteobacteria bacterium]|nr:protein-L-isoaspartate(D-aspartate) O-methyltransferase [Gammaproteobacteria bacterium]
GIRDPAVMRAMRSVPRDRFVPKELIEFAYDDTPLPIDADQTISQPYIVALMADALELEPHDKALEIGTGSGYAAAILGAITAHVYTIERHETLCIRARTVLEELGFDNVHVRCGDGTKGWPEEAPFDAIAVTAGGPVVPKSLREQLAVGGRLVIPVGDAGVQRLKRVWRTGEDEFEEEDFGPVRFVPLIGAEGWSAEHGTPAGLRVREPSRARGTLKHRAAARPTTAAEIVARAAEPLERHDTADLKPLLARIADARVVLLGEASHGTAEFYDMRARITLALLDSDPNFRIVAVEADWPDARQVDRFVRGLEAAPHPERAFTRFPTWMWANKQVLAFINRLRDVNAGRAAEQAVGFHGLDLYSLRTSIRSVLAYLEGVDREAAALARARYACLVPWEHEPAAYGAAAARGRFDDCADEVARMLADLLRQRLDYERKDEEGFFDAERNAALVKNAERYYRAMYYGRHESWNLRDEHMFETLRALLHRHGSRARAVVWAHNSHLGNAAATTMSARGETNVGELCRTAFGDSCYAVGFGTDHGTVAAANDWDAPLEIMQVRPAHEASYERVCHDTRLPGFLMPLRRPKTDNVRAALLAERLERAIGVIYRPDSELVSHYFHASLPRQFDEWIWFDETTAIDPLPVSEHSAETPETFPFGV